MGLTLVLSIVAMVLAVIVGIMQRASTWMMLLAIAVVLLATVHVVGSGFIQ